MRTLAGNRNEKWYQEHREKATEYMRGYYQKHKEEQKERRHKRYEENKEQEKEYSRQYRAANLEKKRASDKQYRETHRDERLAYGRRWRQEKRWKERGNVKLIALRGTQKLDSVAEGAGVHRATLKAAEKGKIIPDMRTQTRLAYYYSVDISELGFDDAPESMKQQTKTTEDNGQEKSKATQRRDERIENMPTLKGAVRIIPGMIGKRCEKILEEIRQGMKPQMAWQQYQVDIQTYSVFHKIIYGGLSEGKTDVQLGLQAGIKYERQGKRNE